MWGVRQGERRTMEDRRGKMEEKSKGAKGGEMNNRQSRP
jgi:hypothetical protein